MPLLAIALFLLVIILAFLCYRVMAAMTARPGKLPSPHTPFGRLALERQKRREAALKNFKVVHAAARDSRKQAAKIIQQDPAGAAKIVGNMLKKK